MSGLTVTGRSAPALTHKKKEKKKGGMARVVKKISVAGCCMTHGISSLDNVPRAENKARFIV